MRNAPEPGDKIIDTRDLLELLAEYEDTCRTLYSEYIDKLIGDTEDVDRDKLEAEHTFDAFIEETTGESDIDDYTTLKAFLDELNDCTSEVSSGETCILDDYFEEYAEEFAADIGAIDPRAGWPLNCINWKQAAKELLYDYSEATWDGYTYYVRNS